MHKESERVVDFRNIYYDKNLPSHKFESPHNKQNTAIFILGMNFNMLNSWMLFLYTSINS